MAEEAEYYYTWTAGQNGVLTVTVSGDYWSYRVTNTTTNKVGEWHYVADENAVASESWNVKKGDVIVVVVSNYDAKTGESPAAAITVVASFEAEVVGDVLKGDVNGDGKINARDAMLALRYVAGEVGDGDVNLAALDVNSDGKVNARDAMLVLRYVAGEITEFPV